jgi:hypothetical protein
MPTSDKKISALPEATTIANADLHVIVQGGVTKKITHENVQGSYLQSANNLSDIPNAATALNNLGALSEIETQQLIDNTFGEGYIQPGTPGVPSGTNYFNSFAAATPPLRVFVTGYNNRTIFFRGMVDCSGVTFPPGSFVHVFTLTALARPSVTHNFLVYGLYDAIGAVTIFSNGEVHLKPVVGDLMTSGIVDFSGISYYTLA